MIIKNGTVFKENGTLEQIDLYVENEQIQTTADTSTVIDATDCYVLPGLIDLHFHGCNGFDFCDATPEALEEIAKYQAQNGITAIAPASMTLGDDTLEKVFKNAASYHKNPSKAGADLVGINMEGPYVSEGKKGAQNGKYLHKPEISHFRQMNDYADHLIKLVTLAPELEGSEEFIKEIAPSVSISLGHTTADYDTAKHAFSLGANHVTHLYNAMNTATHRSPGILGAAYDSAEAMVELICDGIHIHPSVVRSTFQIFGDDRIILISDSMMATGLSDGNYSLGGQAVTVKGSTATLSDGTIAGSATNLFQCMKRAVSFGIPLESAVRCASVNPAKRLGIYNNYGSLAPGKLANILIVDKNLDLKQVILHGTPIK